MRTSVSLLLLLGLAGIFWAIRSPAPQGRHASGAPALDVPPTDEEDGRVVKMDSSACRQAAYLCSGLAESADPRVIRWPDSTSVLRIRVPLPPDADPARARALQREAAAGIRRWQGRPIPLRIETTNRMAEVDFEVRWVSSLAEAEIGRTTVRWTSGAGTDALTVIDFLLATHTPTGAPVELPRLRLTAAHEMGHVLGLPHSDDPNDVMYPYNTATRLTRRDFSALAALYALPAGYRVDIRAER